MRIIIFTGKGGVGKTSVAASTAAKAASQGYKTLVMSTDPAHSLADSFDIDEFLGPEPREIAPNLFGLEVDIYDDLRDNWEVVRQHFATLMSSQGVSGLLADEIAILPGMDELFSLVRIKKYFKSREYDVLVVDCAPTGETLRMLSLPETLKWAIKALRNTEKYLVKPVLRPLSKVSPLSKVVAPEEVFTTIDNMFSELEGLTGILSDTKVTSVRLVMNPEKMVIKESQRALTYLGMYGLMVDNVIVNRILPADKDSGYMNRWKTIQQKHLVEIHDSFVPLPIRHVPMYQQEVVGLEFLTQMGNDIYGNEDATSFMYTERPYEIYKKGVGYELKMYLPFANEEALDLWHKGDELIVQLGNQRRIATLPVAVAGMEAGAAEFEGQYLIVSFSPATNPSKAEPATSGVK
ncbi:MAG: ArsA family ATPase [Chloroflexi bacterium]|uniref:arsenite-transporting ATPase n=1 Tax=Candidatus Chlorohelix allophototropha TaxID=3003348 RepID=A0A8T7M111_9CHLR|nr:ArsA family ATPase [Chloroflexota bacterium]WJW67079.1 TRC40/GET3/ArsA family transport-energizing ATPase [Chloroflexota bacterium L227-S17]